MNRIDHLMWGAADLEAAMTELAERFGQAPVAGGSHPGRGTRNALLGLGPGCYLEIIAPDPAQSLAGTFGGTLADLDQPALITFAVASGDLAAVARHLQALGHGARGPVHTRRRTPAGAELAWDLLFPTTHPFGSLLPFYIDWGASRHPADDLPAAGRLESLRLAGPMAEALRTAIGPLQGPLELVTADAPSLTALIRVGSERVELRSARATAGLTFG